MSTHPSDHHRTTRRYCVIGAGAAGMAAMHALIDAGHDFDCFEANDRVGGHWHTDYDNLHLITPRDGSGFRGDPMPGHWPDFPRRAQMVEYLEGYADRHDLRRHVTFGTRVERLDPVGPNARDGWDVTVSTVPVSNVRASDGTASDGTASDGTASDGTVSDAGTEGITRRYAGVLVANGHNSVPNVPVVPGHFDGETLHSVQFTNANAIAGQRVLVVGSGNSGCDIASELAQTGHDVVLSVRHGHLFQPKSFFGKPRGTLKVMKLPPRLLDPVLRAMIRLAVGRPETYGLPAPVGRSLNDQRPVVNSLVLHWIQHGRIEPRPGLDRFDGRTVHFVDGTTCEVDTVVWATGFKAALPFLPDELVLRRGGVPLRVAGCILPYRGPSRLYYVGLCAPRGPQLPVYSDQAAMIMEMLDLQERLDRSLADVFTERDEPEARIDIVRSFWNDQMAATAHHLTHLASSAPRARTVPAVAAAPLVGTAAG